MLEVKNLTFSYDNRRIIYKDISFKITNNGIYYLTGKNGTGKTTLFKILKGIIKTNNNIYINDVVNDYPKVTYIDYKYVIENGLNVREYLSIFNNDLEYIDSLIDEFYLDHVRYSLTKSLSDGEKSRLAFVQGLLENNNIILIDEIFSHIDDVSLSVIIKYIEMLSHDKIIIFTNHNEDIKVKYNYIMKIKYNNITISDYDLDNNTSEYKTRISKINYKIIDKVIKSKINYIFMIINVIFLLFLSFIIYTLTFDSNNVLYKSLTKAKSDPYVISRVLHENGNSLESDDLNLELNSNNYQIFVDTQGFGLIDSFNLDGDDAFNYSFRADRIFVTDKFDNKTLNDNEVVISDFMNFMLRTLDDECTYSYIENDILYIKMRGLTLKVVDVLTTDFDFDNEVELEYLHFGDIKVEKYIYKLDPFRSNYYYHNIYLNENTINDIYKNYKKDLDESIVVLNKKAYELGIPNKEDIVMGRLPFNDNEIVLPMDSDYNIGDNRHIYMQFGIKDSLIDLGGKELTKFKNLSLNNVTVVGLTNNMVGFTSNKVNNIYNSFVKYHIEEVIDLDTITIDKIKEIRNNGYVIMSDNYTEVNNNLILWNQFVKNSYFILITSIILFIISNLLFIHLYYTQRYKGIRCLFYKNINKNIIIKRLIKCYLSICIIGILVFSIFISVMLVNNYYATIIYSLLGIL